MASIARRRVHNRIREVMLHLSRYGCKPQARLAEDAGVSPAAISRLLAGRSVPTFALVMALTRALEDRLDKRIDPRELVSFSGDFPTKSVCDLCGCPGCLPPQVYGTDDEVRPEYRHIRSGQWALRTDAPGAPPQVVACGPEDGAGGTCDTS